MGMLFGIVFEGQKLQSSILGDPVKTTIKINSKNHQKHDHPKTWNLMPKGYQNVTKIDAKTHKKSMPKLVTKRTRTIIKNNVSLKGKIIEMHWKNKCFWWFRRLHTRTVKVSKKHQRWDQNPSENRYKKHARKRGSQKKKNHPKSDPKRSQKSTPESRRSISGLAGEGFKEGAFGSVWFLVGLV